MNKENEMVVVNVQLLLYHYIGWCACAVLWVRGRTDELHNMCRSNEPREWNGCSECSTVTVPHYIGWYGSNCACVLWVRGRTDELHNMCRSNEPRVRMKWLNTCSIVTVPTLFFQIKRRVPKIMREPPPKYPYYAVGPQIKRGSPKMKTRSPKIPLVYGGSPKMKRRSPKIPLYGGPPKWRGGPPKLWEVSQNTLSIWGSPKMKRRSPKITRGPPKYP